MSNIWAFAFLIVGVSWAGAFALLAMFKYGVSDEPDNTHKIIEALKDKD